MFGLGKHRTKIGKHIDKFGYSSEDFRKATKISTYTATKLTGDSDYVPGAAIMKRVMNFIRKDQPGAKTEDYFDI